MAYDNIIVEKRGGVGLVTFNRPKALNALSAALIAELIAALDEFEADPQIGCIVLTGSQKAFAAGADIAEIAARGYAEMYGDDFIAARWERVARTAKPIIAAVAGYALGGGCEIALMCDFIVAADTAQFGQPEINIGTIPGAGGSQRLARAIGKAKTMDMCLTGRNMGAEEAERAGIVARVVAADALLDEAVAIAQTIAEKSQPIAAMAKEAINNAFETGLTPAIRFERRLFHATFATEDQKEGMSAFLEKRKPAFKNR
ncbi:MAG: enoyl-CoA hydratase [Alphaproteobacteria bacterium]|nr:enoyl-CoA hydratase [Alphaproteobacteria bacterium]